MPRKAYTQEHIIQKLREAVRSRPTTAWFYQLVVSLQARVAGIPAHCAAWFDYTHTASAPQVLSLPTWYRRLRDSELHLGVSH